MSDEKSSRRVTTVKPMIYLSGSWPQGFENLSYLEPLLKHRYFTKEDRMATQTSKKHTENGEEEKPRKVEFSYEGDRMIIPEGMDLDEAKMAIERQIEEESVNVTINEPIRAFPFDGAVALMRVLKRRYGWTHLIPTEGFFGPRPPAMVGVEIAFDERVQVPWGNMCVPKINGNLTTGVTFDNGIPMFQLSGTVQRKHERIVHDIANEIRKEVKENSIYRGQTVKINFRDGDGERREFDWSLSPKFFDASTYGDCEPIFSKSIEDAIRINLHTPIKHSKRCRQKGASLKKGIMLGGPYGTGKTLTAFQTAQICKQHGWTFLYLEDVRDLDLAINFAKLYQPCVVFAEDVDKAASGPRTPEMDRLLNTIDGVESKGEQSIVVCLTTNHLEIINRAFLRPGRIDRVINVTPPDEEACLRIVKKYVAEGDCKLAGTDEELKKAIACLVGANAAFFRNVVEGAKLAAIDDMASDDDEVVITSENLRVVAEIMVPHCKLINPEHGKKSLLDLEEGEQHDPMQLAMSILVQKLSEGFLEQLANPKILQKVLVKQMRPKGPFGPPSCN